MSDIKYDVAIVGAGTAGLSAAIVLAKAAVHLFVVLPCRFPGSSHFLVGVFYSDCMNCILELFPYGPPVVRHIIVQFMLMIFD